MLLPHGAVIAVVDGEKFELYKNTGKEAEPALETMPTPSLDEHNMGSGGRHYSGSRNPQDSLQEEDAHAAAVTEWLNQQILQHKIEHLVVIAAPRTLGEMRRHYHSQLKQALLGERNKDLAGRPSAEIIAALHEV